MRNLDNKITINFFAPNPKPNTERTYTDFKIISVNTRSMNTSVELLRLLVFNYEPDVLLIQETFLTKGKETPEINEYTPYRKDRTLPRQVGKPVRGGGLLTYVHNKHKFSEIVITQSECDSLEISAVEIQCEEPLIIYNIYRTA